MQHGGIIDLLAKNLFALIVMAANCHCMLDGGIVISLGFIEAIITSSYCIFRIVVTTIIKSSRTFTDAITYFLKYISLQLIKLLPWARF